MAWSTRILCRVFTPSDEKAGLLQPLGCQLLRGMPSFFAKAFPIIQGQFLGEGAVAMSFHQATPQQLVGKHQNRTPIPYVNKLSIKMPTTKGDNMMLQHLKNMMKRELALPWNPLPFIYLPFFHISCSWNTSWKSEQNQPRGQHLPSTYHMTHIVLSVVKNKKKCKMRILSWIRKRIWGRRRDLHMQANNLT